MIKRIFDIVASFFGLVLLLPLFAVVAACIKIDSRGPIFFRQKRVGKNGQIFRIHKFRTMFVHSETGGRLTVGADSRITKCGGVIRKYKVDELPQLIDVLLGDMSMVGPRPEVQEFINEYPDEVREKVLSVKPGITDMASIEMVNENEIIAAYDSARDAYINIILPIKQKHYVHYVDNHSFIFDLRIIFLTISKILFQKS